MRQITAEIIWHIFLSYDHSMNIRHVTNKARAVTTFLRFPISWAECPPRSIFVLLPISKFSFCSIAVCEKKDEGSIFGEAWVVRARLIPSTVGESWHIYAAGWVNHMYVMHVCLVWGFCFLLYYLGWLIADETVRNRCLCLGFWSSKYYSGTMVIDTNVGHYGAGMKPSFRVGDYVLSWRHWWPNHLSLTP